MLQTYTFFVLMLATFANSDDLKMVHVLWRHGDRTPLNTIPNDTNNTLATWPQGFGELTPLGMGQECNLGKLIRSRYDNAFIDVNYYQKQLYVRADDFNRTLMSAMANLAGFYMNSSANVSVPGWPSPYWQPTPVHTIALDEDNLLYMSTPCPTADQIMNTVVMQQSNYKSDLEKYKPLFDYLDQVCGFSYPITLDNIGDVWDPLTCELVHSDEHPWPNFINDSIFEDIYEAYAVNAGYLFSNQQIARLRAGNLLGEIVTRMNQKRDALQNPLDSTTYIRNLKYYAYSAHDTTTLALLNTLGAANVTGSRGMPGFSASVLVELWNKTDGYYVKTFYRHNATGDYFDVQVDGCPPLPALCYLDTFSNRSVPYIPTDWYAECGLTKPDSASSIKISFLVIFLVFGTTMRHLLCS